ncbi:hypothetical protein CN271_08175 [Bacillus cereus]|uniref:hypothetical protein n=1 Tax=Bacillus cereus TaxID=1396 RepID=UPI000BEC4A3B|nr:hypothetical protein [Bacillus cereus]PEE35253.1 hypothetical protein CON59_16680 [Bacillus cereus]PET44363.1 hypothetical protein CN523_19525 [Bacillus cereus]PFA58438.1 hypothetical protein CN389_06380 [Bacillus cereus]PFD76765.1 hypothetical protein CN271_08175 [Bacillus cereus]PFE77843.1 hypothetical protein CN319_12690 [Bacillus cereus]
MKTQNNTGSVRPLKKEEIALIQQVIEPCPSFTQIPQPDAEYQSSTTMIDILGITEFSDVISISDGIQTVTFSTSMERRQVPTSWATWSSPPFSENSTPPVLYTQGSTALIMTLSVPSRIFGFELEPNKFAPFEFTVVFLSGGTPVGSITQIIEGEAGARLFAAEIDCTCPAIDEVVISGSDDFSIAQVRYMSDCTSVCTDRLIPFTCILELPSICDVTIGTATGFVCPDIECFVGQCQTEVEIDVCPSEPPISCCVTLDTLNFTGTAEVILNIPAQIEVCALSGNGNIVLCKDLMCVQTIEISQTCFTCAGTADCDLVDPCDLLSVIDLSTTRDGNQVTITGFVQFNCPAS